MTGYLLDTNVVSEVMRVSPSPNVIRFLDSNENLWISSMVIHELEYGLQLLAPGRRQSTLRQSLQNFMTTYEDRVLPISDGCAKCAAELRAQAKRVGRVLDLGDSLVAGSAVANNLTLASRNLRDFEGLSINVVNPWDYALSTC